MEPSKREQIAEILAEVVDLGGLELQDATVLGRDVPIDSKEMLRVFSRIQTRFGCHFRPAEILTVRTFGDLVAVACRQPPRTS